MVGTIPVIFADGIMLPFEGSAIDYRTFAVKLANSNVSGLDAALSALSEDQILSNRSAMLRVRHAFFWNLQPVPGDAFYQTMRILESRQRFKWIGGESFS